MERIRYKKAEINYKSKLKAASCSYFFSIYNSMRTNIGRRWSIVFIDTIDLPICLLKEHQIRTYIHIDNIKTNMLPSWKRFWKRSLPFQSEELLGCNEEHHMDMLLLHWFWRLFSYQLLAISWGTTIEFLVSQFSTLPDDHHPILIQIKSIDANS